MSAHSGIIYDTVRIVKETQNAYNKVFTDILGLQEEFGLADRIRSLIQRYVEFLCSPQTMVLFQYVEGAKTKAIVELDRFLEEDDTDDDEIRARLTPSMRIAIGDAIKHISEIHFEGALA
jgi:hypothetical protein